MWRESQEREWEKGSERFLSHLVGIQRGSQPHSDKQSTIEKDKAGKDGHDRDF